jgi:hypothetical protein
MAFICFICGQPRGTKALADVVMGKKICKFCESEASQEYVGKLELFDKGLRKATLA